MSLTLKGRLNAAQPATVPDMLRSIAFGDVLRAARCALRSKTLDGVAGTNKYVIAIGAQSATLPDDAKGSTLKKVYARAGAGTLGPLTVLVGETNAAPAAGQASLAPSGDLLFASADAWTALDIEYEPEIGDVVELTLSPSAADTFAIPPQLVSLGVLRLVEAEALVGTLVGKKMIQIPLDAKPATTFAALKLDKASVQFAVADAVTSARVKFLVASAIDLNAKLEALSTTL